MTSAGPRRDDRHPLTGNSLNDYYAKVSAAVAELTGTEIEVAQVPDGHVFTQRSTLSAAYADVGQVAAKRGLNRRLKPRAAHCGNDPAWHICRPRRRDQRLPPRFAL